jgi:hypothetical protein
MKLHSRKKDDDIHISISSDKGRDFIPFFTKAGEPLTGTFTHISTLKHCIDGLEVTKKEYKLHLLKKIGI